jgi:hypothetical protein
MRPVLKANSRTLFSVSSVPSVLKAFELFGELLQRHACEAPIPLARDLHV